MYSNPDQLFQTYDIGLLNLYNKALVSTIGNIAELNNVVRTLSDNINKLNEALTVSYNQPRLLPDRLGTVNSPERVFNGDNSDKTLPGGEKKYLDQLRAVSEFVKSGAEAVESIDGIGGYVGKVKGVANVVINAADGLESVEKLAKATDTMTKIGAIIEILTKAMAVGKAAASVSPQAAVFTTIGVLAEDLWAWQKLKKSEKTFKVSGDFMSKGIAGGNEYFRVIQQTHYDAAALVRFAKQKSKSEIQKEEDALIAGWLKKGGIIQFDDEQAAKNPMYSHALSRAQSMSLEMKNHPIQKVMFDDERELRAYKQNFDQLNLFPAGLLPMVQVPYIENNYLMRKTGIKSVSVKEYREMTSKNRGTTVKDKGIGNLTPDMIQDNILTNMVDMYMRYSDTNGNKIADRYIAEYVDKLQRQYGQFNWFKERKPVVMQQFGKAKTEFDRSRRAEQKSQGYSNVNARVGGSTGNTINFNKSLIEHFTINVKDGKEAMTDFKRKVEEVLIEILNSVNTIH